MENKKPVSIIIPTYRAQNYIEECLNSIEAQSYFKGNNDFEILLGIDGCEKTLKKVQQIKGNYRNLQIYVMNRQVGPYITINSLIEKAEYDNIITFDSDDIMLPQMVKSIMNHLDGHQMIQFGYILTDEGLSKIKSAYSFSLSKRSVFFKKSFFFNKIGGYKGWKILAEEDLLNRIKNQKFNYLKINRNLFVKRSHPNSLSSNIKGKELLSYKGQIKEYKKDSSPKIPRLKASYNLIWKNKSNKKIYQEKKEPISKNLTKNTDIIEEIPQKEKIIRPTPINHAEIITGISILITAYESQDYIEECLDSIKNQTYFRYNKQYEILLGIDNCTKTLKKVQKIRHKYNNLNLRVFMMDSNRGTYVTMNTLLDFARYKNILRFDSDDIMKPEMIDIIMKTSAPHNHIIRFQFQHIDSFSNTIKMSREDSLKFSYGVCFFQKKILDQLGGYQPWICLGDCEIIKRAEKIPGINIKKIPIKLFLRRIHQNSLTQNDKTGWGTPLRNEHLIALRRPIRRHQIKIKREKNTCIEINIPSTLSKLKVRKNIPISIIISAYKAQNFIEECLDSIESQSYFKENNYYEILVGIDGCLRTKEKLLKIQYKYRNIKIFMMEKNNGPYITFNTLIDLAQYENLIIFGADDIMMPEMIKRIVNKKEDYDIVRFSFKSFEKNINLSTPIKWCAFGAIYLKKDLIRIAGGFQPWRFAADTEFLYRMDKKAKILELKEHLFYRRVHPESLTKDKKTGMKSNLRAKYKEKTRYYKEEEDIWIKKITANYQKININKIAICIPIYKRYEITDFVLEYYKDLKEKLKNEINLILISCGSEGDMSKKISQKNNFIYIEYPNSPLSQKANQLYLKAKEYSPDACIKIDSDSIVSIEFFKYYNDLINLGYDYSGIEDIYFKFKNQICYWGGYKNYRKGETTGVGRFLSKNILEKLEWKPWGDMKIEKSLDKNLTININNINGEVKKTKTKCKEVNGVCVDIKSKFGITDIKKIPFDKVFITNNLNIDFSKIHNNLVNYE